MNGQLAPIGSGNRISYTLEAAEAGTDWVAPYVVQENMESGSTYSKAWTVEELNTTLIDDLGIISGGQVTVEARIRASVADGVGKTYKICLDIRSGQERMLMSEFTPYGMIYMIGDATSAGWTLGDAVSMEVTNDPMYLPGLAT